MSLRRFDMSKIDAVRFVLKCQNWREIAIPVATHKPLTRIALRNGYYFEAPIIGWWDVHEIYFKSIYNPVQLPIEKDDVVVDIGANIGLFTVYAASRTQNAVYAFEPSPGNFETLMQNIRASGLINIIPFQNAVSNESGIELFCDSENSTGCQLTSVFSRDDKNNIEVHSITLQDIMDSNNIEKIDFLKMDCEGSEGLILESTSKDYFQRIRKIAMEFHDDISKLKHDDIEKLLERVGFITAIHHDSKSDRGFIYAWRA
jgi:FkbM family methyltransferase